MTTTSATIASSLSLRLRYVADRIYALGPRPLFELMCELAGGADPLQRFETYARLDSDIVNDLGGCELPPVVKLVR
jgi:hypothetical protein